MSRKLSKRIISTFLSVALAFGLFLNGGMNAEAVSHDEEDEFMEKVVSNYEEYMEYPQSYYFLIQDSNFSYEQLVKLIKAQDKRFKYTKAVCDCMLGVETSTDDCLKYLNAVMAVQRRGMMENMSSLSQYNNSKKPLEYGMDTVQVLISGLDLAGADDELMKLLKAESDLHDAVLLNKNQAESLTMIVNSYSQSNLMLDAIIKHGQNANLVTAAKMMRKLNAYECVYFLDCALNYGESISKIGFDFFDSEWGKDYFTDWLMEKGKKKCAALVKSLQGFLDTAAYSYSVALLTADAIIGNEYRYLDEIFILSDIAQSINAELVSVNPEDAKSTDKKFQRICQTVPLLQSLCCVRLRGEYCNTMLAKMNDSFGHTLMEFVQSKAAVDRMDAVFDWICDRYGRVLKTEYDRISEILIVNMDSVYAVWKYVSITMQDDKGKDIAEITSCYPELTVSNADKEGIEKINAFLKQTSDEYVATAKGNFEGARVENGYLNTSDLKFSYGGRMDGKVVSVLYKATQYYSGAVRPIHGSGAYNFDVETGEQLALKDILADESKYNEIANVIETYCPAGSNASERIPENAKSTWKNASVDTNRCCWFFTYKGWMVRFSPGEIASTSEGYIDIEIPYRELSGLLKDEYITLAPRSSKVGTLEVTNYKDADTGAAKNYIMHGMSTDDKNKLYITAVTPVYDVAICKIDGYSGSKPYSDTPYVTLGELNSYTMVILDVPEDEEGKRMIMIQYRDKEGQKVETFELKSDGSVEQTLR